MTGSVEQHSTISKSKENTSQFSAGILELKWVLQVLLYFLAKGSKLILSRKTFSLFLSSYHLCAFLINIFAPLCRAEWKKCVIVGSLENKQLSLS